MPTTPKPACPRCGYDLSGQVAAWHPAHTEDAPLQGAQCPLAGTCSECGLGLEWSKVFRPTCPLWYIEHQRHQLRLPLLATGVRALLPAYFWRRIALESPWRPRRLGAFAGAWALVVAMTLTLAAATWSASATYASSNWWGSPHMRYAGREITTASANQTPNPAAWSQQAKVALQRWPSDVASISLRWHHFVGTFGPPPGAMGIIVANLALLAVLMGVPHTRRLHRVRTRHVARAIVFAFAPLAAGALWAGLAVAALSAGFIVSVFDIALAKPIASLGNETFELLHLGVIHALALGWLSVYWRSVFRHAWRLGNAALREMSLVCVITLVLGYAVGALHAVYWYT
jgi:hypothetical protein